MAAEELISSGLWQRVSALARKARRREAAVAYVTAESVRFGAGDLLITDASVLAIKSGMTKAKVLQDAHRRGAEVYSFAGLHAKVLVLDETAVIGSANLSASSEDRLIECAVITKRPGVVAQARAFLQQVKRRSTLLTTRELEKLRALPVERRPQPKTAKRTLLPKLGNRCWMIGITDLDEDRLSQEDWDACDRAREEAESKKGGARMRLNEFRLVGNSTMRGEAKPGDRVIMVEATTAQSRRLTVRPPVVLLACAHGKAGSYYCYDELEMRRKPSLTKGEFVPILREAGFKANPTPRMVREVRPEDFNAIAARWGKR